MAEEFGQFFNRSTPTILRSRFIEDELEEFFRYFFPQMHAAIDFSSGCQSRDKELAKQMVDADVGDREADKLFEVTLPEALSRQFDRELEDIVEALNMPYVTSIERRARQEGHQEGRQEGFQEGIQQGQQEGMLQGVRDLLQQTLQVRFGMPPVSVVRKIEQCQDVAILRALHQQALTASSIAELTF